MSWFFRVCLLLPLSLALDTSFLHSLSLFTVEEDASERGGGEARTRECVMLLYIYGSRESVLKWYLCVYCIIWPNSISAAHLPWPSHSSLSLCVATSQLQVARWLLYHLPHHSSHFHLRPARLYVWCFASSLCILHALSNEHICCRAFSHMVTVCKHRMYSSGELCARVLRLSSLSLARWRAWYSFAVDEWPIMLFMWTKPFWIEWFCSAHTQTPARARAHAP